jgi:hypothetical protein
VSEALTCGRGAVAEGAAGVLSFAAAPTFAIMALLTAALGAGPPEVLCSTTPVSALNGMAVMYALMSAFHAAPWVRLIAKRRSGAP